MTIEIPGEVEHVVEICRFAVEAISEGLLTQDEACQIIAEELLAAAVIRVAKEKEDA